MIRWMKGRKWILVLFTLFLFVLSVFVFRQEKIEYQRNRTRSEYIALSYADQTEYIVGNFLQKAQLVSALTTLNLDTESWFNAVAAENMDNPAIICIAEYDAAGRLCHMYPKLEYDGIVQGTMCCYTMQFAAETAMARNLNVLTLAGPVPFCNGENVLVGIQPLYIIDENGMQQFHGFLQIILRMSDVLQLTNLQKLEASGWSYRIKRRNPNTEKDQVIGYSSTALPEDAVACPIVLPNAFWVLEVAPIEGWFNYGRLTGEMLLVFFSAILATLISYIFRKLHRQGEILEKLAITDTLTSLYNRHRFMQEIETRCKMRSRPFALCYIDVDDFKKVNDQYGHDVGDLLLRACARRIQYCLKKEEMLFRIGGDEMVAFLEIYNGEWETRFAAIDKATRQSFYLQGQQINISLSLGWAVFPEEAEDSDALLRRADAQMYKRKNEGKNV
ncbi:MAG: GGDEF domain-containing protein [Selenomonadaceae bacterium]